MHKLSLVTLFAIIMATLTLAAAAVPAAPDVTVMAIENI